MRGDCLRKIDRFTKEEIEQICKESSSISEVAEELGYAKESSAVTVVSNYIKDNDIDISHFTGRAWNKDNFDYSRFQKGKKVQGAKDALIHLRGRKCEICGNTEWQGKEIPLVIHHMDGDHLNNELSNLQLLCPNCHAQTDNYCGKNIGCDRKYTEEQFVEALRNTPNINQALISMGIHYAARCYYEKAYELIKKYDIDQSKNKITNPQRERSSLTVNGISHTKSEWSDILGVRPELLRSYTRRYGDKSVIQLIKEYIENPSKENETFSSFRKSYMSKEGEHECPICGKKIQGKKYCSSECAHIAQKRCTIPDREKLKEFIRSTSFLKIGKMFGISDNTVRKWCKMYNLPFKLSDIKRYTDEEWQVI